MNKITIKLSVVNVCQDSNVFFLRVNCPCCARVINRGSSRVRRTLESWHTAITSQAENNSKQSLIVNGELTVLRPQSKQ